MQRFFDIIFSGIALIILTPLLLVIIIILRLTGEREIFFLQDRVGKNGKTFNLCKFATMLKNSPNLSTGTLTVKNDPRILPLGHFLRKTKINELPQLVNILVGNMSIVGPRPLTFQTFDLYSQDTKKIINRVRPGLSGIGSIVFRNEEVILKNRINALKFYREEIAPYKGSLEEWYVKHKNLKIYFLVIMITIWVVVSNSPKIAWRIFPELPIPNNKLKPLLNLN
jgi:lipopolysaccharide/colanic/teichoic acid biosynthesis glycosyltransferase